MECHFIRNGWCRIFVSDCSYVYQEVCSTREFEFIFLLKHGESRSSGSFPPNPFLHRPVCSCNLPWRNRRIYGKDKPFRDGMASRCRRRAPSVQLKQYWSHVQHGDVADGAVVVVVGGGGGAGARDARVEAVVAVEPGAVDGGAAAGLAADVPRRRPRRFPSPSPQDCVERRRCTRQHASELS